MTIKIKAPYLVRTTNKGLTMVVKTFDKNAGIFYESEISLGGLLLIWFIIIGWCALIGWWLIILQLIFSKLVFTDQ